MVSRPSSPSRVPGGLLVLAELSRAVKSNPAVFGRDARVAVGTGTETAPTWLLLELTSAGPARLLTRSTLPPGMDAAVFLSSDGADNLVAGDQQLLEATFRHFLGGVSLLGLRAQLRGPQ